MQSRSIGAALTALLLAAPPLHAAIVDLGTAANFAVLAGQTVTNTGPSVITGDIGLSPGSAITGFPPGTLNGALHVSDAVAVVAQNDLVAAFVAAASPSCTADLTGQNLGGLTLTAGTYCFASGAQLTGTLTLDAQGNSAAQFLFRIGSTLTTASAASVIWANGGGLDNDLFWQVGSSATLGTTTAFTGNIMALTSITLDTGATIQCGRALARNGAVTLDSNTVSIGGCAQAIDPSAVPEPSSWAMLLAGFGLAGLRLRRRADARAVPKCHKRLASERA